MSNWEVGIIVVTVLIVAAMWYQNHSATPTNPTNAASKGYLGV